MCNSVFKWIMETLTKGIITTTLTFKIYFIRHFKVFSTVLQCKCFTNKDASWKMSNFIWKTFPNKIFIIPRIVSDLLKYYAWDMNLESQIQLITYYFDTKLVIFRFNLNFILYPKNLKLTLNCSDFLASINLTGQMKILIRG